MVGQPGLGDAEPSGLLEVIVEHAPAGVAEPGGHDIADHRPHAGGGHVGEGHAVGLARHVAHEAVADG